MDILEKARQHFPLETTGQPFQTHELQRIKVVREMADEIERLREAAKDRPKDRPNEAADEIERLRKLIENYINEKSDLKRAMIDILEYLSAVQIAEVNIKYIARKALGEIDALKEGE